MVKVSIIVPVYNVQGYLPRCLNSIINQTFKDMEIICVNDGSTDNSQDILEFFAHQDRRIKIINKKNGGVSVARNEALKIAQGNYLMFVDSDDWLDKKAVENCYNYATKKNMDLVVFNFKEVFARQNKTIISNQYQNMFEKSFNFEKAPKNFFYIMTSVWGKFFRKAILPNFERSLVKGEDSVWFWEYCLINNPSIYILDEPLYYYYNRPDSAMKSYKHVANSEIIKSAFYLSRQESFQKANNYTQMMILERFAQSICWEISQNRSKLKRKYIKTAKEFINLFDNYKSRMELKYFVSLDKKINKTKYWLHNIIQKYFISITSKKYHKEIKFMGIKFNLKQTKGRVGAERYYINLCKKEQKKYPKDTYLLFDCLHDVNAECIDAYSLFEEMQREKIPAYYVIRKQTKLYKQLLQENKLDNVIVLNFSTRSHPNEFIQKIYPVLLRTKAVITSFGENSHEIAKFFKNNSYWQYIFIQHGPTFMKESVLYNGYLYPEKFDKFLICSDMENKIFSKYKFPDSKLIKVGLPRWDLLSDKPKAQEKSILLMLTWRKIKSENVDASLYKKHLLHLLNNENLKKYLRKKNIKLYFAPHHALKENAHIELNVTENVEVISCNEISYYIKHCQCLITDFSSVAFDFMFQNKPVLFYILDYQDRAVGYHDREDLDRFAFKRYLLPDVFFSEEEVLERLKYYVERNFKIDKETKQIYNKFFYTKTNIRKQLIKELEKICSK